MDYPCILLLRRSWHGVRQGQAGGEIKAHATAADSQEGMAKRGCLPYPLSHSHKKCTAKAKALRN